MVRMKEDRLKIKRAVANTLNKRSRRAGKELTSGLTFGREDESFVLKRLLLKDSDFNRNFETTLPEERQVRGSCKHCNGTSGFIKSDLADWLKN